MTDERKAEAGEVKRITWDEKDPAQEDGLGLHLSLDVVYDTSTHFARKRPATAADLAAAGFVPAASLAAAEARVKELESRLELVRDQRDTETSTKNARIESLDRERRENADQANALAVQLAAERAGRERAEKQLDQYRCRKRTAWTLPGRVVRCAKPRGHSMGCDFSGQPEPDGGAPIVTPSPPPEGPASPVAEGETPGAAQLRKLEYGLQDVLQRAYNGEIYLAARVTGIDLKFLSDLLFEWRVARIRAQPTPTGPSLPSTRLYGGDAMGVGTDGEAKGRTFMAGATPAADTTGAQLRVPSPVAPDAEGEHRCSADDETRYCPACDAEYDAEMAEPPPRSPPTKIQLREPTQSKTPPAGIPLLDCQPEPDGDAGGEVAAEGLRLGDIVFYQGQRSKVIGTEGREGAIKRARIQPAEFTGWVAADELSKGPK